jgi:hypothetical protein
MDPHPPHDRGIADAPTTLPGVATDPYNSEPPLDVSAAPPKKEGASALLIVLILLLVFGFGGVVVVGGALVLFGAGVASYFLVRQQPSEKASPARPVKATDTWEEKGPTRMPVEGERPIQRKGPEELPAPAPRKQ